MKTKATPNQGVWQSGRNGVICMSIFGLSAGLIGGLSFGLIYGPLLGLIYGLLAGLIGGSTAGLIWGGGLPFIQHFALRFVLYRNGYLPWNLVRFLDYAAERIFLRKVGGGYIFVHRTLMEHFASQDVSKAT